MTFYVDLAIGRIEPVEISQRIDNQYWFRQHFDCAQCDISQPDRRKLNDFSDGLFVFYEFIKSSISSTSIGMFFIKLMGSPVF